MRREWIVVSLAAALSACTGTSPPVRFYALGSDAPPPTSAAAATYSVVVGPVTIPELVDRPQLVVRLGANRVELLEQSRWAAPLETEIPRVLAAELARLLDGARTTSSAQRAATTPDYRVMVDVQRFDSAPSSGATVEALWTVRPTLGQPISGRSSVTVPAGSSPEELVAAHSRALAAVARDIAGAVEVLRQQR